jgi:hypothetical protein
MRSPVRGIRVEELTANRPPPGIIRTAAVIALIDVVIFGSPPRIMQRCNWNLNMESINPCVFHVGKGEPFVTGDCLSVFLE